MKKILFFLLITMLCINFSGAKGLQLDNQLSKKEQLVAQMKYGGQKSSNDSVFYDYQKSPALAFTLSAVLPGAGQYYADKKWWAVGFFGVEALGLGLWYDRKTYGENMEDEYESFADQNWSIKDFLQNLNKWSKCEVTGHNISVYWKKGDEYHTHTLDKTLKNKRLDGEITYNNLKAYLQDQYGDGELGAVKDRSYYENIGKYDQFACGWEEFPTEENVQNTDTVFMSPKRNNYLTKRKKSNDALKFATKSLTVVMFNHLISTLHAQLAVKQSEKPEKGQARTRESTGWQLSLLPSNRKGQFVQGINLSFSF